MDAAATMKMTQRIGRHGQLEKCQVSRVDPQDAAQEIAEVFASVSSTLTHHNESGIRGSCDSYPEWTLAEATLWVVNVGSVTVRDWINDQTYEIYRAADSSEQNPVLSGWATVTPGTTLSLLAHINPSDAPIWPLQKPMWSGEGVGALEFSDAYGAPLTKVYVDESGSYTIAASSSWPCLIGLWVTTPPLALVAVDANNDGVIEFDGSDATTADAAFRFWVAKTTRAKMPWLEEKLNDLEDYCRIRIRAPQGFDPTTWRCRLFIVGVGGRAPELEIWPAKHVGLNYLTSVVAARAQLDVINDPTRRAIQPERPGTQQGTPTNRVPVELFDNDAREATLLFKAIGIGTGRLTVEFSRPDAQGRYVVDSRGELHIDIRSIATFFERARTTVQIAPPYETTVWVGQPQFVNPAWEYRTSGQIQNQREARQVIVFVHGVHTSEDDFFNIVSPTTFKRLYWSGFRGRLIAFRWENMKNFPTFNRSEYNAWICGAIFENFLTDLRARQDLQNYQLNVLGYSQGNVMISEALRLGATVDNYVLWQAAIPAGCYDDRDEINQYEPFLAEEQRPGKRTPDWGDGFPDHDELGYRGYLKPIWGRVGNGTGNIENFYNVEDYALATGKRGPFRANWEANQIGYKPDGNQWASLGQYRARYTGAPPRVTFGKMGVQPKQRDVTDAYESMAFVARPRSKASGAVRLAIRHNIQDAVVTLNHDLQSFLVEDSLKFTGDESDHSGQFDRPIQTTIWVYQRTMRAFPAPAP